MTHASCIRAGRQRQVSSVARIARMLLLLAVIVRAMMPAGFMPSVDRESGVISVAMCSGAGAIQTLHLGDETPEPSQDGRQTCTFASLSAPAIVQPTIEIVDVGTIDAPPSSAFVEYVAIIASTFPLGAPPTGPPTIV